MPQDQIIVMVLKDKPKSTALEIFNELKTRAKTGKDKKALKTAFPEQDQTIRERLRVISKSGAVFGADRPKTVLTEWSLQGA